jgi:hypothetical protein
MQPVTVTINRQRQALVHAFHRPSCSIHSCGRNDWPNFCVAECHTPEAAPVAFDVNRGSPVRPSEMRGPVFACVATIGPPLTLSRRDGADHFRVAFAF